MNPRKARQRIQRFARQRARELGQTIIFQEPEPIFTPRLLKEDELPGLPETLRQFINSIAEGRQVPELDEEIRKGSYSESDLPNAIREGIRRWDSRGKERA